MSPRLLHVIYIYLLNEFILFYINRIEDWISWLLKYRDKWTIYILLEKKLCLNKKPNSWDSLYATLNFQCLVFEYREEKRLILFYASHAVRTNYLQATTFFNNQLVIVSLPLTIINGIHYSLIVIDRILSFDRQYCHYLHFSTNNFL